MIIEPAGLSERALRFLEVGSVDISQFESGVELDAVDFSSEGLILAAMRQVIENYRRSYEGRGFKIAGGPLEGSILFGCGPTPRVRESRNGILMFRAARHEHAQCDIVVLGARDSGARGAMSFTSFSPPLRISLKTVQSGMICVAGVMWPGWTSGSIESRN